jgi:hypothetical protein
MMDTNPLSEPPQYPRCNFFYDWLKGAKVVNLFGGEKTSWIGERGECYITSDQAGPASVLALDHYSLLPYKNTKLAYDESRLFLEIIASCLQVDAAKRPTVEQLLRTIPFSQSIQLGDILDQYMRQPDSTVFVREFFQPSLQDMSSTSFPFALGIVAALVFHEEMADEDAQYSFQLDSRAADEVINSLFEINLMDRLVCFVLNRVEKSISYFDVTPAVKFKDETFTGLLKLVERCIIAIEHGHGSLLNHVDEVVMALLALYTGNPLIRFESHDIAQPSESRKMASSGSAAMYVFTHMQVKILVQFALQGSSYIINTLKKTAEHNDAYFTQFLSFSDKVFTLANAMCHSIERLRSSAISLMENLWNFGQTVHIVRLFIDFRVPQMIIHCFLNSAARLNSCEFVNDAIAAIRLKSFEPTFLLLQSCVSQPTVMILCNLALRSPVPEIKQQAVNIINRILYGDCAATIASLVVADVLWLLADNPTDPLISAIINDTLCFSSPFVLGIMHSSVSLQRALGYSEPTMFVVPQQLTVEGSLEIAKRLSAALFIRQSSLPDDLISHPPPFQVAIAFLMRAIDQTLLECSTLALSLDEEVKRTTRFDLKGTTFLKAKATARATDFGSAQPTIEKLCDALLHLFRCLCFYWREPGSPVAPGIFSHLCKTLVAPIPKCDSMPHPAFLIHQCIQRMMIHCLVDLPDDSPVRDALSELQDLWPRVMTRDVAFVVECVERDIVEVQLMTRYPEERRIRQKLFQLILLDRRTTNLVPLLKCVVGNMLHNRTQFKAGALAQHYQFPLRSEAISMVIFVLNSRGRYDLAANRLVDELLASNFLEQEKRLTDNDVDQAFMDSSIGFLRLISQCRGLFEDSIMKQVQALLESLCMRFSREWMNTSAFGSGERVENKSNKAATRANQAQRVPKLRALTSRGGELLGGSTQRPGSASARVTKKPRDTDVSPASPRKMPQTAFGKR